MKKNFRHIKKSTAALLAVLILLASVLDGRSQNMFRKASDFDGDGRADYAITRNEGGLKYWWIWQTTEGMKVIHWGLPSDRAVAGDYDGDGKTDLAIYRESGVFPYRFYFYIRESNGALNLKTFNYHLNLGNSPAQQDYNGDGRVDPAAQFADQPSAHSQLSIQYSPGSSGTNAFISPDGRVVRIGDIDGTVAADIAYYKDSDNILTTLNVPPRNLPFGLANDHFVMADFDGDGKGEIAIWRPSDGMWWWIKSTDGTLNAAQWGIPGDTPVPADYDGDGKTDLAVWRSGSPGVYWINGSQNGAFAVGWGTVGDAAVGY